MMDFTQQIALLDEQTDHEAREWINTGKKVGLFWALKEMKWRFFKTYFLQKNYKQGVPGLFASVNAGMFPFLAYAKYWEMKKSSSRL